MRAEEGGVEAALHVLRLALTPSRSAFSSEGAGWLQHDPFAAVKLLHGLPLVSKWWSTVVAAHERTLWRCVAVHLRATIPRHYQEPPRLAELLMCPVFVPSVQPSTAEQEYGTVRKLCAPVTRRAKISSRTRVITPDATAVGEEDWRASVWRCAQRVRSLSNVTCEDGERAVKVNGEMTDLWDDLVITHNVRMFGVYQIGSAAEPKRCFQMRGGTRITSVFAALRPSAAHGVQMLCVILTDEYQLVLNVLNLKSGCLELMVTLKTSVFIVLGLQMTGFLTASNRWLGVHTDQAQVALWDLTLIDEAIERKKTAQSEGKRLELESSVEVDERFYAVHPSRDALALACPNFVGIYDIVTARDGKAQLQLVATVELARCRIACLAFNSRLVAVIEHEQPHIQLYAFAASHLPNSFEGGAAANTGHDLDRPTPLTLTKISPLLLETTTVSSLRCVTLDDRRLYHYHHSQRGYVRIFDVLACAALPSHAKEPSSSPRAQDAICGGDQRGGDVTRLASGGLLFELEARLLVGPSTICVQSGATNDLCLFPLQRSRPRARTGRACDDERT